MIIHRAHWHGDTQMNDHREHGDSGEGSGALTGAIIDSGLKVHRTLGPGLLESAYEHCLAHELQNRGFSVQRQVILPIHYYDEKIDAGYRLDLVVGHAVIVEVKAVQVLTRLHEAQIMTYLKLSGYSVGLLLNFNVSLFKDGIKRIVT
jgi:GxxExxY protein